MKTDFVHLKTLTTYSLKKSTNNPEDLIAAAKEQGCKSLAITEKGNVSTAVRIFKEAKKNEIKPILGIDLYIDDGNKNLSNLTLLCKNHKGWIDLLKVIALSNSPENFNKDKELATIKIEDLASICSRNFIAYSGNLFSNLIPPLIKDYHGFLKSEKYEDAKSLVKDDWKQIIDKNIGQMQDIFGRENFVLESQKTAIKEIPAADISVRIVEWAAKHHKIPCVGTCTPHYLTPQFAQDHKLLICIDKKTTLRNIDNLMRIDFDPEYFPFFKNNNAYLLNENEYKSLYSQEQLEMNAQIASLIENYDILGKPKLPYFKCLDGKTPYEFLFLLCTEKLNNLKISTTSRPEYQSRLNYELGVIKKIDLASYFLIIWDVVEYCHGNNWLASSRGSVGGSLVAYLLGISECDPIKYGLIFERFYNEGRNTPGNIAFPDIDLDLMARHREDVVEFVREKYGRDCTGGIATFGGTEGASALKEVLRINGNIDVMQQNEMTKLIIKKDKITDELEELRLAGNETTVIGWSIDNIKGLKQYVDRDDDGNLIGEYAKEFEQAIRIEGCKRFAGSHACGLIVSTEPLINSAPLILNKKKNEATVGWTKEDCEAAGLIKYDFLAQAVLDDIHECIRLTNEGDYDDLCGSMG